eukprot:3473416-Rhodomonas_salina.1
MWGEIAKRKSERGRKFKEVRESAEKGSISHHFLCQSEMLLSSSRVLPCSTIRTPQYWFCYPPTHTSEYWHCHRLRVAPYAHLSTGIAIAPIRTGNSIA